MSKIFWAQSVKNIVIFVVVILLVAKQDQKGLLYWVSGQEAEWGNLC